MNPITTFKRQPGIVKVLIGTLTVVLLLLCYAVFHYGQINRSEDPRVIEARELLLKYEKGLESDDYGEALSILHAMESIYLRTPGYDKSYEIGVIQNNKASIYLVKLETAILSEEKVERAEMLETLSIAEKYTQNALQIYEQWLEEMGSLSREEIDKRIRPTFDPEDPYLKKANIENVITKRVDDIILAQVETKRRLSVTYANMGVVSRYKGELEEAKAYYEKALTLWDRNYTAKDNLNILMNQPIEKRSMIDRLFPPERSEDLPK